MPRLFIGLPVPDEVKALLNKQCSDLEAQLSSKIKWTAPKNWHVTLKFLGKTDENLVPELQKQLKAIQFAPFVMQPGKTLCFPNTKKPRVIGLGFKQGAEETATLAKAVDTAATKVGFEPETRDFKAHLTLGRVKRLEKDEWATALGRLPKQWPSFTVNAFTLWESELTQTGPIYHPLATYPSS